MNVSDPASCTDCQPAQRWAWVTKLKYDYVFTTLKEFTVYSENQINTRGTIKS